MTWITRYHPPEASRWQGRADTPAATCFFQHIKLLDISKPFAPAANSLTFALLGFCCDEGIRRNLGRTGAANGPRAIREMLAKLPLQRHHLICYDAGDILCNDQNLEASQSALAEAVAILLKHGITPIVMGGGHEIAWGHYQGIAKQHPRAHLGIINFDAHFDMRPLIADYQGSSGTPFLQIANAHAQSNRRFDYNCIGIQPSGNIQQLFDTARQYHTQMLLAEELHQGHTQKCSELIDNIIHVNDILYVSLCLDVFAAADAPGVSAPQALGLSPWQIIPFIRQLAASGKVISYDIAELSPAYDIDHRTAKLAANFIFEIIHYHAHATGLSHEQHTTP